MTSLEGKVFAVTGAASGIGLATAHLLAARGASLSIADVRSEPLATASESIQKATPSVKLHSQVVNVGDSRSVNEWHDSVIKHYGQLDGAANLAGIIGTWTKLEELDDDTFDKVINVNLKGVFNCIRAQLQRIKGKGSIVSAASVAGLFGAPTLGPYCASKVSRVCTEQFSYSEACADISVAIAWRYWLDKDRSKRSRAQRAESELYRSVSDPYSSTSTTAFDLSKPRSKECCQLTSMPQGSDCDPDDCRSRSGFAKKPRQDVFGRETRTARGSGKADSFLT